MVDEGSHSESETFETNTTHLREYLGKWPRGCKIGGVLHGLVSVKGHGCCVVRCVKAHDPKNQVSETLF